VKAVVDDSMQAGMPMPEVRGRIMTKALVAVGCVALCAGFAFAGGGTINSGNASLQLVGPTVFSSSFGDANMRIDGASSPDQLSKYTWYYRTQNNNINSVMSKFDTASPETYVGDTATAVYTNAGPGVAGFERFNATITTKLEDGANPNEVRVTATCLFTSAATTTRTYQVFVVADLDLAGGVPNPGPDDRISFDPTTFTATHTEASSSNFGKIAAITPSRWQVGDASAIRAALNGSASNLNNSNGPFSGDSSCAFQWTLTLAPGESRLLTAAFAINQEAFAPSCPCSADFDNSGGTPDAGDVDAFFSAWLLGDATADADCSGGTPDAGDVDTFFAQWLAGGC
jgi:hypothetical protein